MNIEIQIKIGELVIGYEEARELYAKLRTVFGATTEKPNPAYEKASPIYMPIADPDAYKPVNVGPPPVPIGTLATPEGAVAVLKDSYVPPAGQVDSGTLCP